MISILLIILFFGFYLLYTITNRIKVHTTLGFETKLQKNIKLTKYIAMLLLVVSTVLAIYLFGLGVGVLFICLGLMTLGGFIIMLAPLQLITYKNLVIVCVLLFIAEWFHHLNPI
ncbi:hypothetical protein FHR24_002084 [Wenyingzhuangia heitensis]|uniref:Uncharacterized protein n=1 Tax=Wenyingzhuangia heitensis TaxID=1487859 RepID=A0ABX0UEJ4_9FLAO|nr:hypothetical protein [Wenyingzhuangia heitensis]NIJ45616.1 hypothetical protein [Wenyingzhuangia heitensis]